MASRTNAKRTDMNTLRMEILSEFNKLSEILSHKMDEAKNKRTLLQDSYDHVKTNIDTLKKEIINELQRLEDDTMKLVDRMREKAEEQINKYRADLELRNKSITASIDRITHNKSIFSAQKEIEYLETAQLDIAKITSLESRKFSFKKSTSIQDFLKQFDRLGVVEVTNVATNNVFSRNKETLRDADSEEQLSVAGRVESSVQMPPVLAENTKDMDARSIGNIIQPTLPDSNTAFFPVTNTPSRYRNFTWERKFRLELSDRHKVTDACCVNSIAVLNNKFVAVCDSPHNCIQLFNGNYELLEEIECPRPRGICTIPNDTFAISIHSEPIIKLLIVNQSKFEWAKDLTVSCNSWIRDIKQVGKYIYMLCDNSDIHRVDLKGKKAGIFPTGLAKHQSRHLCVSKDASKFFVSGEEVVICIDKEGKQIWKYHDTLAKTEGRGLALFDNNILVSDWKNSSLIELTEDGKLANVIKDIGYPYALYVVEGERISKVFVTQFSRFVSRETRRCVHVHRIEKINETTNNSQ